MSSPRVNPFTGLCLNTNPNLPTRYLDVLKAWPDSSKLPILYSPRYNISFFGIEKLHPFDSTKFSKIVAALEREGALSSSQLVDPLEAPVEALMDVHSEEYLHKMHTSSWAVAKAGDRAVCFGGVTHLAAALESGELMDEVQQVSPMKYHVAGTIAAAALATQYGWAINVGGGMHHAYATAGMGWCPFDDIYLSIRRLREAAGSVVKSVLYIDLDAHQGNGVERDKLLHADQDLFILDVYNAGIFPKDDEAKAGINLSVELKSGTGTPEYLSRLKKALEKAATAFKPDLVFYNAGTDVLSGDPLGRLDVDQEGVVTRDEMVWRFAAERVRAPIIMTLSGGYAPQSAAVVTRSLSNLIKVFNLTAVKPDPSLDTSAPVSV